MTEADRIHAAIMNLPINGASELINRPESKQVRYKLGHRDARRAAAELAQESIAKLERENAKLREACETVLAWYDRDGSVGGACDPMEALRAAIAGNAELTALRAENKRLRVDAERYAWVKRQSKRPGGMYFQATGLLGPDTLDSSIDAAMKGERT